MCRRKAAGRGNSPFVHWGSAGPREEAERRQHPVLLACSLVGESHVVFTVLYFSPLSILTSHTPLQKCTGWPCSLGAGGDREINQHLKLISPVL